MARKSRNKRTRGSASRPRRWSLRRDEHRRHVTLPLPLSGIHPAQLPLDGGFLEWSRPSPPVYTPARVERSPGGKFAPPADYMAHAEPVRASDLRKLSCEQRHERREVLFATGKQGGGHAPTPSKRFWKESC